MLFFGVSVHTPKDQALKLLWDLILDENSNKVKAEVQSIALKRLTKLIDHYHLRNKRLIGRILSNFLVEEN